MSDENAPSLKTIERRGQKAIEKKANTLQRLVVEYVAIESVKPNSYNPNRQDERDFDLLLRSMREDGFTQPIVVQRQTREIVDGEHRWRGAREIGMQKVPVVFVDMTPEQMRIATLRHNRARGAEDVELATQVLRDLRELGALDWAQESLMLGDEELQKILDDVKVPAELAGEEYSEAWQPSKNQAGAGNEDDKADSTSFTPSSDAAHKEFEAKLNSATTNEERAQVEAAGKAGNYKLVLLFNGDEAELVRKALEPNPAVKLLAYCQAKVMAGHGE